MSRPVQGAVAAALAVWVVACADEAPDPRARPPTAPRAALVLEPPEVGLGQVAVLEVAVVTPPDHRVRPFHPPESVPGFWLLDAEASEVERQADRWLHRTRIRIRAREVGRFQWPAGEVEVEGPDGRIRSLELASIPLEVRSAMPEFPERTSPFGARAPDAAREPGGGIWAGAALGALATLATLGLVHLARRHGTPRAVPETRATADEPALAPWVEASRCLASARALGRADPLQAAHVTASGLRRYVARRFGADAEARTTEELESAPPPFAATSRWPALLAILRGLDALQWPPPEAGLAEHLEGWIDAAERFVEDSVPPGAGA